VPVWGAGVANGGYEPEVSIAALRVNDFSALEALLTELSFVSEIKLGKTKKIN
jgi:hypothetical protein